MQKKNIFKVLAAAMLMPAMLLTTACSSDDDLVNNEPTVKKGYALPVTVNVTRQGDAAGTRATFDGSKLNFGEGDKLFVEGPDNGGAGQFAGTLTWQSGGTFSGTIYTQNPYPGTADELFSAATSIATLLPNGYQSTGFLSIYNNNTTDIAYDDEAVAYFNEAFVASETAKATGVEQLSFERATTYNSGFALTPRCAILNFTISGLEAGEKTVTLNVVKGTDHTVTGSVTPNASGVATFAIGVPVGSNIKDMDNNLTVGTHNFTLPSSTTFAVGKIYNITRAVNAINGKFTINGSGDKVQFSKGNLQYTQSTSTWSFMDHQYSTVETANQNVGTDYANQDVVSLYGWGTSNKTIANYGSAYQPWSTNTTSTNYGPKGTYNLTDTYANGDWGVNMGSGWRTLTQAEWAYVFGTNTGAKRSGATVGATSNARYTEATINTDGTSVNGVILFPDGATIAASEATTWGTINGSSAWGTQCTTAQWSALEAKGCVFLPAAGYRDGSSVYDVGSRGLYWSATARSASSAYYVYFSSDNLYADYYGSRYNGYSVRLVREVE